MSVRHPTGPRGGDTGLDGRWGRYVVEVKSAVRSMRQLHDALLRLAGFLDSSPKDVGLLLMVDPRLSSERLDSDLDALTGLLRADLSARIRVVVAVDGAFVGLPLDTPEPLRDWLDELVRSESHRSGRVLRRPSARSQVLELLVGRWLEGRDAVTTKWLQERSGFSYPPVAAALREMGREVVRTSDRRVGLSGFPTASWSRLVAEADEVRSSFSFVDRSGQPRSPEALRRRIERHGPAGLAFGGVDGARHHAPELDLVGAPWISVSLHCPAGRADLAFLRRVDPALALLESRPEQPPALVVHCVQRPGHAFETDEHGSTWADPVSCLLDLHEARLESAAAQFVSLMRSRHAPDSGSGAGVPVR